ncbi:MAG: ABC transporter permease [Gemmatimonadota bacterium]|nr:ABC transporter permease [Gemmatimonadota bacterium]
MLKSHLIVSWRNLKRHRVASTINISSLAIGIAAVLLIAVYVQSELSYDRFHKNVERIFRLSVRQKFDNGERIWHQSAWFMGPRLSEEYPFVHDYVRFFRFNRVVEFQDRNIRASGYSVDASVFDIFTFPLVKGDARTALARPFSIVITESLARELFGNQDPLERVIKAGEFKGKSYFLTVTGVLKDVPRNSHISFDYLFSINSVTSHLPTYFNSKGWMSVYTYVLLDERYLSSDFVVQEREFMREFYGNRDAERFQLSLQPLTHIHLDPTVNQQFSANVSLSRSVYIYVPVVLAFFILVGVCTNVVNLNTARFLDRSREIGARRVLGARRSEPVFQIATDSLLIVTIVLLASVTIATLCLPWLNRVTLTVQAYEFEQVAGVIAACFVLLLLLLVGFGTSPALWLHTAQPPPIAAGRLNFSTAAWLKNLLFAFQFAVSTFLLIGASIVFLQLDHIDKRNLGLTPDHVFYFSTPGLSTYQRLTIERELRRSPLIHSVASGGIPGGVLQSYTARGRSVSGNVSIRSLAASRHYVETLGIEIDEGRDFSVQDEYLRTCLLNETAVRLLGLKSPIGEEITWWRKRRTVVGVVKDFNFMAPHNPVEPLGIFLVQSGSGILVRIHPERTEDAVNWILQTWSRIVPQTEFPSNSGFLTERLERWYARERGLNRIVGICVCITLLLAGMGLAGFVKLTVEQDTKQIGVRRVLGASKWRVVAMYSGKFIFTGLLASVLAWPVAYFFMSRWLQDFSFRIQITADVFIFSTVLALSIIVLIVAGQTLRAAGLNPADAIREE